MLIATLAAACLAFAAPTLAAPKGDKPNKQDRKQADGQKKEKGEKLCARLEDKLGHELTADQKQQIQQSTRSNMQSLKPVQEKFVESVATAVRISTKEVKQAIKSKPADGQKKQKGAAIDPAARIYAALETHLNRKLTEDETKAIDSAIEARKAAAAPIQEQYVASLAKITGLSADDVKSLLPRRMAA